MSARGGQGAEAADGVPQDGVPPGESLREGEPGLWGRRYQWWRSWLHCGRSHHGYGTDGGAGLWLLASALGFSLMAVCVKKVGSRLPVAEVVLARAVVSLILSWWLVRRAGVAPWGQRRGLLMARGVLGSLALLCVYLALTRLPLATATLLQYLYPTFTALLAWPLLGERIGLAQVLAMPLGWLGVLLVARSAAVSAATQGQANLEGVGAAIAGALLTALAYVSVRGLGRSEHPLVIVLYFALMAVPLSLPLVLLDPVLPTARECLWLLGVGLFTQVGQIGLTQGLTRMPAARATAIGYTQVGFAALWGWWWFAEPMDGWTAAGAVLILAAAALSR